MPTTFCSMHVALLCSHLVLVDYGAHAQTPPLWTPEFSLEYRGGLEPELVAGHATTVELNKEVFPNDEDPPSLASVATKMLSAEFLNFIHPPFERSHFKPLVVADPACINRLQCVLHHKIRSDLAFRFSLFLTESTPSTECDQRELESQLSPIASACPPPEETSALIAIEIVSRGKIGKSELEMFAVDTITTSLKVRNAVVVVHEGSIPNGVLQGKLDSSDSSSDDDDEEGDSSDDSDDGYRQKGEL